MKTLFIADKLSDEALRPLKDAPIEVDNRPGLPLPEKLAAARKASAIIVRSETKCDRSFLEGLDKLELIVRAGVGVDNIDVEAATRKGIVVQNIPDGNVRSAAEHTIALILSLARRGIDGLRSPSARHPGEGGEQVFTVSLRDRGPLP